jgi:NAD(P)-dependent dehydrogenase (short-subunit alcohol dehydrogenase family)
MTQSKKVWFITGSSRGFGRVWARAALTRGDLVAATARDTATLQDLVEAYGDQVAAVKLDVTDKPQVEKAIADVHARFGRLDVVINNAGYGQIGAIEEVTEEEARAQFETNVFGTLWVTKAALPFMRSQRSGHIIQNSSIGGLTAFPNLGLYNSSKWAIEGFSQSLAHEVAEHGIKVTLIEPAGFATDWSGPSAKNSNPIAAYDSSRARTAERRGNVYLGDPDATGPAMLALVDAPEPPLRVFFGDVGLPMIRQEYMNRIAQWEDWDHVSKLSQGSMRNR